MFTKLPYLFPINHLVRRIKWSDTEEKDTHIYTHTKKKKQTKRSIELIQGGLEIDVVVGTG